jgi:PAS domain S-box-containing protein
VAGTTLVEDVLGVRVTTFDNPFGLDPGDPHTPVPGRMAQMTAVTLLMLVTAVVLSVRERVRAAQALAVVAVAIGMTAVIGYAYGVRELYGAGPFDMLAVHTAVAIVVAGLAVFFLRPGEGYVVVLAGNSAGGVVVRRLLPWVAVAPITTGAVAALGLHWQVFDGPMAIAVVVSVVVVAGAVLIWLQGEALRGVDVRRRGAEDALAIVQEALAARDRFEAQLAASERHTRQILSTAADAYVAIDDEGRVTDWNDAAASMLGWTADEATGRTLDTLFIPPDQAAAHRIALSRGRATGESTVLGRPRDLEAVVRSGARIPVEVTVWADPVDGHGYHAFMRDLTERRRAEQELRIANADLAEFAAIAAHDLKSPLATIQMQVELLRTLADDEATSAGMAHWIERIGRTAARGAALIDDLLDYVSIGRQGQESAPVDLTALACDVAEQVRAGDDRGALIEVEPLPVASGDPAMLAQLLANLLTNAVKYVPADRTPRVVVDAVAGAGGRDLVIRVTDNGVGFAPDERQRVFEMFQRGSGAAGVPGTGIGLAICRRVAERHGGRIWVEDGPAGGSRMCVQLPRSPGVPAGRQVGPDASGVAR